mgnify:CR=1 FL=1
MYYVKKTLEISAAHSLTLPYDSKCTTLHGHNWLITICCRAQQLNANGMVTDFSHIKQFITDTFDHRNLNQVLAPLNPTAENMARYICEHIENCYRVEVCESSGNTAAYEID